MKSFDKLNISIVFLFLFFFKERSLVSAVLVSMMQFLKEPFQASLKLVEAPLLPSFLLRVVDSCLTNTPPRLSRCH